MQVGIQRVDEGLSPNSVLCYAEQSVMEHLNNEVCTKFAEDLTHKLWLVINVSTFEIMQ